MKVWLVATLLGASQTVTLAQQMDPSMPMPGMQPSRNISSKPTKPSAGRNMKSMRMMKAGQKTKSSNMADMGDEKSTQAPTPPPAQALEGPQHAADTIFGPQAMAPARGVLHSEMGDNKAYMFLIDRFETEAQKGGNGYRWDGQAWYGGDINKLWFKSEGNGLYRDKLEKGEVQALWSRAITPFFDLQTGVKFDFAPSSKRTHFALGVQGFMPYSYNVEATMFLSTRGELTARAKAEYDQRITQRLILQPRIELNFAAVSIRDSGIGAGLSTFETGLRLRYEFIPEFAPYIGLEYERKLGITAGFARSKGENPSVLRYVTGVRAWF